MRKSDHNLLAQLNEETWIIANPLAGTADLLTSKEADDYQHDRLTEISHFKNRGYLVNPDEEAAAFQVAYVDFLKERETDEVQIFYVPTYACNFQCDYCYQLAYENPTRQDPRVLEAFFDYVDTTFRHVPKYLTLFGGEPLLNGAPHKREIARFLEMATARGLETAVVTNGYHIQEYLGILDAARLREVQITLDGVRDGHDTRRPLKRGGGTFHRIVDGIDALLERNITVNLRLVLDRGNINQLPRLADFAVRKGWTNHPAFKTQLGRNYALHHCQKYPENLYERLEMARAIAELMATDPQIAVFHKPTFHLAKTIAETGTLPAPNFDACPAAKTEWGFDYTGRIYGCTATLGKTDACLGTFYPEIRLDEDAIFEWQDRDVLAIEECRSCNARLVCGGGCGALAYNRNGTVLSPDCRPVAEITAAGASIYLKELIKSTR